MKKFFIRFLSAMLILCLLATAAFADNTVTAQASGTTNVPLSDGYHGFCVNFFRTAPSEGDSFTLADASIAKGNAYDTKPNISQYLKILMTQYFTDFWTIDRESRTYTLTNTSIGDKIWTFSNLYYESTTDPHINGTLAHAANGLTIPDSGYVLTVDEDTQVVFEFRYYAPADASVQTLIGMKATVLYTAPDGGNPEGGNPEGGNPEGGNPEGGNPEGGNPEGGNPEGGNPEGGNPEGGNPEGGNPEGGNPEGGNPEGGNPEGGNPEGGNPEGGNPEGGNPEGGNDDPTDPDGGDETDPELPPTDPDGGDETDPAPTPGGSDNTNGGNKPTTDPQPQQKPASPETGDTSPLTLWLLLLFASATLALPLLRRRPQ